LIDQINIFLKAEQNLKSIRQLKCLFLHGIGNGKFSDKSSRFEITADNEVSYDLSRRDFDREKQYPRN
jgi:hypothetical protein